MSFDVVRLSDISWKVRFNRVPTPKKPLRIVPLSDIHVDSILSDHARLQEHINWILQNDAYVLLCGDTLDAMQGKFDPRQHLNDLRPEILSIMQKDNIEYYSAVVTYALKILQPLCGRVILMLMGNHETAIASRHGFDILAPLANNLSTVLAGYRAFIRLEFPSKAGENSSLLLYATHGEKTFADAPVTLGVISTNRRSASVQADAYISGHTHNTWIVFTPRLGPDGVINVPHIQCPSYKEYRSSSGFEAEKGQVKPSAILYCLSIWGLDNKVNVSIEIPSL